MELESDSHPNTASITATDHAAAINMKSAFFTVSRAVPLLQASGNASVIMTASTSGVVGSPFSPLYSLTKGGIVTFGKSVALALAPTVRCNVICPGPVDTPMLLSERESDADLESVRRQNLADIPQGRIPDADEIAEFVVFLCSDGARHITGANLPIDGGYTAR